MLDYIINQYLLIKALHIISVICWMAAALYLPRLFVYHTKCAPNSESYDTFLVMEGRLIRYIMTPSMFSSFIFGILLLYTQEIAIWMHIKGTAVILLAGLHGAMVRYHKNFKRHSNQKSETFFRILNEMVTALMVVIVLTAVLKPF